MHLECLGSGIIEFASLADGEPPEPRRSTLDGFLVGGATGTVVTSDRVRVRVSN